MAELYCPCGHTHKLWGEFWWTEARYQWIFFDDVSAVVWSPDGSTLAYSQATPNGKEADIYVMKPDGTDQKNLTNTPSVGEWEFTWSPDGSKLAQIRDSAIYVMNADCTNPVNITSAATPKLWGPPV